MIRYILVLLVLVSVATYSNEKNQEELLIKKFNISVRNLDALSTIIHMEELLSIREDIFKHQNSETIHGYKLISSYYTKIKNSDELYQEFPTIASRKVSLFYQKKSLYYYSKKVYKKAYDAMIKSSRIEQHLSKKPTRKKILIYNNLGLLAEKMGEYANALGWYKLSLQISQNASTTIGGSYLWTVRLNMKQSEKQIANRPKLLEKIATQTKRSKEFSKAVEYRTKGINYIKMEKYKLSLYYLHTAIESIRDWGNSNELANEYKYLGLGYEKMGDYLNALKYYLKALDMREELFGKEDFYTGTSYADVARVYKFLEKYDKAIGYYEKEMKVREKADNMESVSYVLEHIGSIYQLKKEYPKALGYYEKALSIRERLSLIVEDSYFQLGNIYKSMKEYDKALNYYKKVENSKRANPQLHAELAQVYQALSDYPKVVYYVNKSLERRREQLKSQKEYVANYKKYSGDLDFRYIFSESYYYEKYSFEKYLQKRNYYFNIYNFNQKESYIKRNSDKLHLLLYSAHSYYKSSKKDEAIVGDTLNLWLEHKGSVFNDENSILALFHSSSDKWVNDKVMELVSKKRDLAKLYQTYVTDYEVEKWRDDIESIAREILALTAKLSSASTAFVQQQNSKVEYKDISKQLKKDELYIDYAKTEKEYYIFTVDSSSNVNFIAIDENSSKEIDEYIKAFRADIELIVKDINLTTQKNKSSKNILAKLYQSTIQKPLGDILKDKSSLIISTDGALRAMPFEAMYDSRNQKYLIEQKNIRYISSGRELVRLFKYSKQHKSEDVAVIFSNPNFDANISDTRSAHLLKQNDIKSLFNFSLGRLKGSIEEAKRIEEILKGNNSVLSFSKNKANEMALLAVDRPKILHLATHGFFINDDNIPNPMLKSGIVLSGANHNAQDGKDYGVITALKLSGLNLKGTDLVVLSACSTGVVDLNSTENISGLSKAFIQAGAKSVIMSLWEVDDMKTMELMSSFYKESQKSHNYAQALRASKIEMIEAGLHPYFWSAFVLSGL